VTAPPPRRPWWKRKRWWAPLALWLTLGYPFAVGPTGYAYHRGWISYLSWARAYAVRGTPLAHYYHPYVFWWIDLGKKHAAEAASD
jgi:hypothetical protein